MKALSLRARFWLAVGLQFVLLLSLLGAWQYTLMTGQHILLRTLPVDPRDMFRGDYITLSYEISTIPAWQPELRKQPKRGDTIYVVLRRQGRFWVVDAALSQPPEEGRLFLKGKVAWVSGAVAGQAGTGELHVQYGLESYFVPEGEGRRYETARGGNLAVEVAVDRFGHGAVRKVHLPAAGRSAPPAAAGQRGR